MRQEFTKKTKLAAWTRAGGKCENCNARLFPGNVHYDHLRACGLLGDATLANCNVLCRACHSAKTRLADVPNIARAKRRELRQAGINKPKRHRWGYGRGDPMKKKVSGEVVPR